MVEERQRVCVRKNRWEQKQAGNTGFIWCLGAPGGGHNCCGTRRCERSAHLRRLKYAPQRSQQGEIEACGCGRACWGSGRRKAARLCQEKKAREPGGWHSLASFLQHRRCGTCRCECSAQGWFQAELPAWRNKNWRIQRSLEKALLPTDRPKLAPVLNSWTLSRIRPVIACDLDVHILVQAVESTEIEATSATEAADGLVNGNT